MKWSTVLWLLVTGTARIAAAQHPATTHVLVITGLSAGAPFTAEFAAEGDSLADAARRHWGVRDSDLVYLVEDPARDTLATGRSTRDNVDSAFAMLARRVSPADVVLVFLRGHGSGDMESSAVNLPGPDATAADYARWIAPLSAATVVFVNASSASGDFGPLLAGPHRIIITATKTAVERNETIFAQYFIAGLIGTAADANKDGLVSVAEAFAFARDQVGKAYDTTNRLQTEHAVMVDSSGIAARVTFGGAAASADPRVIALVRERSLLEAAVDSLRRGKGAMDSTTYTHSLEQLLLQIATRTQAIQALQSGRP